MKIRFPIYWSSLQILGQNRVVRSSYFWFIFVPIIARLLINMKDNVNITFWGDTWTINLTLPFSWQMFFYSSLFISAATLLFQLSCPTFIINFRNYADFENQGKVLHDLVADFLDAFKIFPDKRDFLNQLNLNLNKI